MLLSLAEDPNNSQPQECSPNASQSKDHLSLDLLKERKGQIV
jgi:hypothetical protein